MKNLFPVLVVFLFVSKVFSQQTSNVESDLKFDKKKFLSELSDNACKCIDSIATFNKIKDSIASEIHSCIDKQVTAYQMGSKIAGIKNIEDPSKEVKLEINVNPDSKEYKQYYYEIERHLMDNCKEVKNKMFANDLDKENTRPINSEAIKYYNLGIEETRKENFEKAIEYYKKAVVFDPNFAFAYDNMGICYRRLNEYNKAIAAYEKSLEINPQGSMPLQNIAIAYSYKKDYKKAVKAFERLAKVDPKNPEVYFGIGQLYAQHLSDYEKALDNLCQAYNIYVDQKSPYRTDAEKLIQIVFTEMRKQGKEATFNTILKQHNINPN